MFDKEYIEELLMKELKSKMKYMKHFVEEDCERFVNGDLDWFGEVLAEEVKKIENAKG